MYGWLRISRVAIGILAAVAMVTQFVTSSQRSATFTAVNYFSYFTNLSNILGIIAWLYTGLSGRRADLLRGAATVYLSVTGIVYNLLLTEVSVGVVVPWVNAVIHGLTPVAMVADWLIDPPNRLLKLRETSWWLAFPAAYLGYSEVRGPVANWYPYPFLDPDKVGAGGVVAYSAGIALALVLVMLAVRWLGNRLSGRRSVSQPVPGSG